MYIYTYIYIGLYIYIYNYIYIYIYTRHWLVRGNIGEFLSMARVNKIMYSKPTLRSGGSRNVQNGACY